MIRPATPADAAALRDVYAPYVAETAVTFETVAPSVAEMAARVADLVESYPWLVHEDASGVTGYAYAVPHRARPAYRWSADVSVYVRADAVRKGVGAALYGALLPRLAQLGYANLFAGIALPNAASVGLHERFGFRPIGVYRKVGYKMRAWHDVGWWQLSFDHPSPPAPPRRNCEL